MRPTTIVRLLAGCSLVLLVGCAAPSGRTLGWLRAPLFKSAEAETKVAESTTSSAPAETPAAEETAAAPVAAAPAADAPATPEAAPATEVAAADVPGDDGTALGEEKPAEAPALPEGQLAAFNAETLKLIDDELKDASPLERQFWFDQLKKVDPSLVPDILRARRMTSRVTPPGTGAEILQASGAEPLLPAATRQPAPAGGFGAVNPWGQPGVAPGVQTPAGTAVPSGSQTNASGFGAPAPFVAQTAVPQTASPFQFAAGESAPSNMPQGHAALYSPFGTAQPGQHPGSLADHAAAAAAAFDKPLEQNAPALQPTPEIAPGTFVPGQYGADISVPETQQVSMLATVNAGAAVPSEAPAAGAPAPPAWEADLQRLLAQVEAEVSQMPAGTTPQEQGDYIRRHVFLRMLYLIARQQERALTAIPSIEPAHQEFWQQTFWAVANYFDSEHIPNGNDRASQTIQQLNAAVQRLQEKANLELRNVAFCHRISSYGTYEKFPRDEFSPGQDVLVYAEVVNFKSEPAADGQYRTLLRSTVEVLSPSGEVRKKIDFKATEDLCRNHRRDYFHSYQFTIPQSLPLGPHVLKLTVFDELNGKMATYSQNFVVK